MLLRDRLPRTVPRCTRQTQRFISQPLMLSHLFTPGLLQDGPQRGHFILQRALADLLRQPFMNIAFNVANLYLRHPLDLDVQHSQMVIETLHDMDAIVHRLWLPPQCFARAFISPPNLPIHFPLILRTQTVLGVCFLAAPERYIHAEVAVC